MHIEEPPPYFRKRIFSRTILHLYLYYGHFNNVFLIIEKSFSILRLIRIFIINRKHEYYYSYSKVAGYFYYLQSSGFVVRHVDMANIMEFFRSRGHSRIRIWYVRVMRYCPWPPSPLCLRMRLDIAYLFLTKKSACYAYAMLLLPTALHKH